MYGGLLLLVHSTTVTKYVLKGESSKDICGVKIGVLRASISPVNIYKYSFIVNTD